MSAPTAYRSKYPTVLQPFNILKWLPINVISKLGSTRPFNGYYRTNKHAFLGDGRRTLYERVKALSSRLPPGNSDARHRLQGNRWEWINMAKNDFAYINNFSNLPLLYKLILMCCGLNHTVSGSAGQILDYAGLNNPCFLLLIIYITYLRNLYRDSTPH